MINLELLNNKINNLKNETPTIHNILLIDRTKSTKNLIKNIIWANNNYIEYDIKNYSSISEIFLYFK